MLIESEEWTGLIEGLSICPLGFPHIIYCRIMPAGDITTWKTVYFSVDENILFPITENEILARFVLPRLK